jgi:cytochrome oxidase Cu insertion factor (SCO1/SenC/PrrC family)
MKSMTMTAAALAALLCATAATAHTEKHKPAAGPATAPLAAPDAKGGTRDAQTYFTDLELLTQDGRKVRFYSDVLKGRTVVINVVYTNCGDACPLITQVLNEVRRRLPDTFGKQVHFISLSSDPKRDSPAAMKQFAIKQGADVEGWTWLTGSKTNLDHSLKKLGMYSEQVEAHSTQLIAGNVAAKRWSKIRPDASPVAIVQRLNALIGEPGLVEVPLAAEVPAARH